MLVAVLSLLVLSGETNVEAGEVIIPKKEFVVEGEESISLEEVETELTQTNKVEFEREIDVEKLTDVKVREKVKREIEHIRTQKGFSLGAFHIGFGSFNEIVVRSLFGKDVGDLNYLITYFRHRKGNIYTNAVVCPNTSFSEDSLSVDFLFIASDSVSLELGGEFLERYDEDGVESFFSSQEKRLFSVSANLKYGKYIGGFGEFEFSASPCYFQGETSSFEYHDFSVDEFNISGKAGYRWSAGNEVSVRGTASYKKFASRYDSHNLWNGHLNFEDVFPVGSVSLKVGVDGWFETKLKSLVVPYFQVSYDFEKGNVRVGVSGVRKNFDAGEYVDFLSFYQRHYPHPENSVRSFVSFDFSPVIGLFFKSKLWYLRRSYALEVISYSSNVYEIGNVGDVNEVKFEGEIRFNHGGWFSSGMKFLGYYSSSPLPFRPFKVEPFLSFKRYGFMLRLLAEISGKQRSCWGAGFDLKEYADLRAEVSYFPSNSVEMSLSLKNILNQRVKKLPWYPHSPFELLAKIEIRL